MWKTCWIKRLPSRSERKPCFQPQPNPNSSMPSKMARMLSSETSPPYTAARDELREKARVRHYDLFQLLLVYLPVQG